MLMASRVPQMPSSTRRPGHGRHDRIRAGRHDDVLGGVGRTAELYHAWPGEPAAAAQQVDARAGREALLPGVGVIGDHEVTPRQRRLDVAFRGGRGLARAIHRLAGAQQRLGRNARPV
jgi:hypothetical protein